MSWQAQTAVTYHSKQTNIGLLRLLHVLAEKADATGSIDPAPNQSTLAEIFDCTDRTIRNRINVLCDSGELKQTRVGSGPGNPSAYLICLPMPENENPSWMQGGKMAETNPANVSTFADEMAEIKAEILTIKAEILELKAEKVETKGGKGGNERRKGSLSNSADEPYRTNYEPEDIYIPPTTRIDFSEIPPEALPDYEVSQRLGEYIRAIGTQVRDYWGAAKNRERFEDAAYMVIGFEQTIDKVLGFDDYWQECGWYTNGGKASIDHFIDHWDDYINGVNLKKPNKNGTNPAAKEQAWIGGAL